MSTYSASIYSVDENGNPANTTSAPVLSSSSSSSSHQPPAAGPSFAPLPPSSAAPPPAAAPPRAPVPGVGPQLADYFAGGKLGMGMNQLSDIARLADQVLSSVEKFSNTGNIIGTIKQKMLHQTPEFVGGLKELAEKVNEVAKATKSSDFFRGIEHFRVQGSLTTTLKSLRSMTAGLFAVVSREKKLAKHVRVKMLERLGKVHYELERLVRELETLLNFRLIEYDVMLKKIKEVRSVLRNQNGIEDPSNA